MTNIVENDCIKIIDYDRIETGVQLRCWKLPGDFFTFGKRSEEKIITGILLMRRFQDNCGRDTISGRWQSYCMDRWQKNQRIL